MLRYTNILGSALLAGALGCSDNGGDGASGTYAMAVIVFGPDNQTSTYVTQLDSLDVPAIDASQGYEFGGQANIATYGGRLFVSDGESPTIKRFSLDADNRLQEDGTISFANFGLPSVSVDRAVNTFISPTKAYMQLDSGTQVIWNPSTLEIVDKIEIPDMVRAGYSLWASSGFARGDRLYRVFYWVDWTTYDFSAEQYFVTYDTGADEILSVVPETRCPNLGAVVTSDDDGTAYFSNWFYNVPGTLQRGKQKSCVLRLPPNSDALDASWSLGFAELTGGREGAQLSYSGGRTPRSTKRRS